MPVLPVMSFHTVLLSRKWAECRSFYGDILGFSIIDQKEGFVEFEVTSESRIGLIDVTSRPGGDEVPCGCLVLSFCVDDLDRTHERLRARWPATTEIREHPWGERVVELADPEGRRIEFWTSGGHAGRQLSRKQS